MQGVNHPNTGEDLLMLVRAVRNSLACGASACARKGPADPALLKQCAQHAHDAEEILKRIRTGLASRSADAAEEDMDKDEGADALLWKLMTSMRESSQCST
jgi:hypothetical protein